MHPVDSIFRYWRNLRISAKITSIYTAVFALVLFLTILLAGVGVYYTIYRQAQMSLDFSIRHTLEKLSGGVSIDPGFLRESPLVPGVILRITDDKGRLILDSDPHFPSIGRLEAGLTESTPFWASKFYEISESERSSVYYKKILFYREGRQYNLYFFRTITSEKPLFAQLQWLLLGMVVFGLIAAFGTGYWVSRYAILKPIRTMVRTAKGISEGHLGRRIPVRPIKDEMTDLAETLNNMLDQIQTSLKQQQRFVSDASHELRTPATVILGYSDLLKRWGQKDESILNEGIDAIQSEAKQMQQLIERLLFLARADQKKQILRKEPINMDELLRSIVRKLQVTAKDHHVELKQNDAALFLGDDVTIQQMIRVFLENSVKYTPKGGTISISSKREGDLLRVELSDTGIGIPKGEQERVFDRFYRTERVKTEEDIPGTGLGLSIAKWVADEHGIKISLESEPGKGTLICLDMPIMNYADDF